MLEITPALQASGPPKGNEADVSKETLLEVHSGFVQHDPKRQQPQCSSAGNRSVDVVCSSAGNRSVDVVCSDKDPMLQSKVASLRDEFHRHFVERRSQTQKILFDPIYINF